MSRINLSVEGFELVSDGGECIASVVWLDLDRVEAHNDDLISLEFVSGESEVVVTEEDLGFEDLAPQLIANLDLENPDWFEAIMRPGQRILVYDHELGY